VSSVIIDEVEDNEEDSEIDDTGDLVEARPLSIRGT
jgi:hypothetical protein